MIQSLIPELLGIGFRRSIYILSYTLVVRAVWTLLQIKLCLLRSQRAASPLKTAVHQAAARLPKAALISNVVIGLVPMVFALAQYRLATPYHHLVILNLNWIIGLSILPFLVLIIVVPPSYFGVPVDVLTRASLSRKLSIRQLKTMALKAEFKTVMRLFQILSCATAFFGGLFWFNVLQCRFNDGRYCLSKFGYDLFTIRSVRVAQIALAMHLLMAIPPLALSLVVVVTYAVTFPFRLILPILGKSLAYLPFIPQEVSLALTYLMPYIGFAISAFTVPETKLWVPAYLMILIGCTPIAVIQVLTEKLVKTNKDKFYTVESWGPYQMLAVVMVIGPFLVVLKPMWNFFGVIREIVALQEATVRRREKQE